MIVLNFVVISILIDMQLASSSEVSISCSMLCSLGLMIMIGRSSSRSKNVIDQFLTNPKFREKILNMRKPYPYPTYEIVCVRESA